MLSPQLLRVSRNLLFLGNAPLLTALFIGFRNKTTRQFEHFEEAWRVLFTYKDTTFF
jgi:hypothetical protein